MDDAAADAAFGWSRDASLLSASQSWMHFIIDGEISV